MSVSTLLSTVAVHVREYVVPLYGSPTLPVVMMGGGTTWVTERKEWRSRGRKEWARREQGKDPTKGRMEKGRLGEELSVGGEVD